MSDRSVSDDILAVLLQAEGVQAVSTVEVARRVGVDFETMVHVLPVLIMRGHLDVTAGSGRLKLSADGLAAARALAG